MVRPLQNPYININSIELSWDELDKTILLRLEHVFGMSCKSGAMFRTQFGRN